MFKAMNSLITTSCARGASEKIKRALAERTKAFLNLTGPSKPETVPGNEVLFFQHSTQPHDTRGPESRAMNLLMRAVREYKESYQDDEVRMNEGEAIQESKHGPKSLGETRDGQAGPLNKPPRRVALSPAQQADRRRARQE